MIHTPKEFSPLLQSLVATFRRPATARRVVFFFAAAILTVGDRTVSHVLRLLGLLEKVNPSTYHDCFLIGDGNPGHWLTPSPSLSSTDSCLMVPYESVGMKPWMVIAAKKSTAKPAIAMPFGLYTLVVIFYDTMPWSNPHVRVTHWLGKETTTFSDMLGSVRRYLWIEWIFTQVPGGHAVQKLSKPIRTVLDFGLAQAV